MVFAVTGGCPPPAIRYRAQTELADPFDVQASAAEDGNGHVERTFRTMPALGSREARPVSQPDSIEETFESPFESPQGRLLVMKMGPGEILIATDLGQCLLLIEVRDAPGRFQ